MNEEQTQQPAAGVGEPPRHEQGCQFLSWRGKPCPRCRWLERQRLDRERVAQKNGLRENGRLRTERLARLAREAAANNWERGSHAEPRSSAAPSSANCDCGGEPHGKHCALVLIGAIEHEPPVELPTPITIGELRARFNSPNK